MPLLPDVSPQMEARLATHAVVNNRVMPVLFVVVLPQAGGRLPTGHIIGHVVKIVGSVVVICYGDLGGVAPQKRGCPVSRLHSVVKFLLAIFPCFRSSKFSCF